MTSSALANQVRLSSSSPRTRLYGFKALYIGREILHFKAFLPQRCFQIRGYHSSVYGRSESLSSHKDTIYNNSNTPFDFTDENMKLSKQIISKYPPNYEKSAERFSSDFALFDRSEISPNETYMNRKNSFSFSKLFLVNTAYTSSPRNSSVPLLRETSSTQMSSSPLPAPTGNPESRSDQASPSDPNDNNKPKAVSFSRSLYTKIKDTLHHYWIGSKLLVLEFRIAFGIIRRILQGYDITRRERRQLVRSFSDLLRMIPFAVIVIVPFMEFLLPVLLTLFPNMLPSTFEDKLRKEEALKKQLKAKIEIAKLLQDTVSEIEDGKQKAAEEKGLNFSDFMIKIRSGQHVSHEEIIKFAKIFKDEFTLDNLSRTQLVAMCKYMGIPAFGSDAILQFQLYRKLRKLNEDDKIIQQEGVNSLTIEELQAALRARGMRATSNSKYVLRRRLKEWLDLSLNHNLPASLLILSRAFVITEKEGTQEALKEAISSLPDDLLEEVKLTIDRDSVPKAELLEALEKQSEVIKEEFKELHEEKNSLEPGEYMEFVKEKIKDITEAASMLASSSWIEKERNAVKELKSEREKKALEKPEIGSIQPELSMKTQTVSGDRKDPLESKTFTDVKPIVPITQTTIKDDRMHTADKELEKSATQIGNQRSNASSVVLETNTTQSEHTQTIQQKKESMETGLKTMLNKIVFKLEKEVDALDKMIGTKLKIIDEDNDGLISSSELEKVMNIMREKLSDKKLEEILEKLDTDKDGKLSLKELLEFTNDDQLIIDLLKANTGVFTAMPPQKEHI